MLSIKGVKHEQTPYNHAHSQEQTPYNHAHSHEQTPYNHAHSHEQSLYNECSHGTSKHNHRLDTSVVSEFNLDSYTGWLSKKTTRPPKPFTPLTHSSSRLLGVNLGLLQNTWYLL